jgi:hypothetical protein
MGLIFYAPDVSLPEYKRIVEEFLHAASFTLPPYTADPEFNAEVLAMCLSQDLPTKRMPVISDCGCSAAKWFYPSHPREVQLAIAKFIALTIIVDDMGEHILEGLKKYRVNLLRRERIGVKVIQSLFDQVLDMGQYYDGFAQDMMFKGVAEFLTANVIELETKGVLTPVESTPNFTSYLRQKSGISETFTLLLFLGKESEGEVELGHLPIIPELMRWTDETNDILSFYKESIVGDERDNSIYLHALSHGQSPLQSLLDYQTSALGFLGRIKAFLDENEGLRKVVEEFVQGYLAFHFTNPRYRFRELGVSLS